MWKCQKCSEEHEVIFDQCWNCQTFKNGITLPSKSITEDNKGSNTENNNIMAEQEKTNASYCWEGKLGLFSSHIITQIIKILGGITAFLMLLSYIISFGDVNWYDFLSFHAAMAGILLALVVISLVLLSVVFFFMSGSASFKYLYVLDDNGIAYTDGSMASDKAGTVGVIAGLLLNDIQLVSSGTGALIEARKAMQWSSITKVKKNSKKKIIILYSTGFKPMAVYCINDNYHLVEEMIRIKMEGGSLQHHPAMSFEPILVTEQNIPGKNVFGKALTVTAILLFCLAIGYLVVLYW